VTEATSQIQEISGGSGLYSQESMLAEFGLGSCGSVDTLEIHWPEGSYQYEYDIAAGQVVTFVEDDQSGLEDLSRIPETYRLHQSYPNPFSALTVIRFDLPRRSSVSLSVYDVLGRLVYDIIPVSERDAGRHAVSWSGRDRRGEKVSPGIYFCRFRADGFKATSRIVVLK
jgi:hypothetical protein